MKTVLLLVLMTIHVTSSKPLTAEVDVIVFPNNSQKISEVYNRFSKSEKECFKKGQVLYNGLCETLLKNATCSEGQWLILDYNSMKLPQPQIRPKCATRHCLKNLYYWPDNGKCYSKLSSSTVCPVGNELADDIFGDGVCQCKEDPPHGPVNNGTCYPLYSRGPCKDQFVFAENDDGVTECIPDKCYAEKQKYSQDKILLYLDEDKQCYEEKTRGPCPEGEQVRVDHVTKKPACGAPTKVVTLNLVNPPLTCATDHGGHCAMQIRTKTNEGYLTSLLLQADRKRNKRKLKRNQ